MLYIISGPSGAGKGTIVQGLLVRRPDIVLSVSYTTRPPRPTERDGEHYYFVSPTTFSLMRQRGDFVECAEVHGNYYGTSRRTIEEALASGRDVLLEIDVQGARQIRDRVPEAVLVFIAPPSREELERRLRARGTEDPAELEQRLRVAFEEELPQQAWFDHVVENRDLQRATGEVLAIIESYRRQKD